MEDENQLPLKRVELSLSKFNDVAIPHHLDLLRQHKANIIKYQQSGELGRVRAETAGAARAAARLRALLGELGALRGRVRAADRAAFDARTQRAHDLTLQAIMDYLGLIERSCAALAAPRARESSPMSMTRRAGPPAGAGSVGSTDSVGVVRGEGGAGGVGDGCDVPMLQLQIDDRELALAEREAALRGWAALQDELRALHAAWGATRAAAAAQREHVEGSAARVQLAADRVLAGRAHLSAAEKLRAGAWCAGGAALGLLAGGPVGLAVGAKAGAAAALAGSLLGYCGARLLGRRRALEPAAPAAPAADKKTQ